MGAELQSTRCLLCNEPGVKVKKLVAVSAEGGVCDKCIALLCDITGEEDDAWRKRQIRSLMKRGSGRTSLTISDRGGSQGNQASILLRTRLAGWISRLRAS